jgi:hypothetical protein
VHALIGDVCGRGPAEAALGVCLRVAWRALVLAGRPADEILSTLSQLLEHERQDDTMFATLCMVSVAPGRRAGWVRMAGHLPPLLVNRDGVRELPTLSSPPLGLGDGRDWPGTQVRLDGSWSVLLFTDGLIEGRIGQGSERLGSEGLMDLIRDALGSRVRLADDQLLDQVIDWVMTNSAIRPLMTNSAIRPLMTNSAIRPLMTNSAIRPPMTNSAIRPPMTNERRRDPQAPGRGEALAAQPDRGCRGPGPAALLGGRRARRRDRTAKSS